MDIPQLHFQAITRFLDLTKQDVMQQVLNRVDTTINKLDAIKKQVKSISTIVERGQRYQQIVQSEIIQQENLTEEMDEMVKEQTKQKEEENEVYTEAVKGELKCGLVELREECGKARKQMEQTEKGVENRLKQQKTRLLADMEQTMSRNKQVEREMRKKMEELSKRMRLTLLQEEIRRKKQKQILLARISDI